MTQKEVKKLFPIPDPVVMDCGLSWFIVAIAFIGQGMSVGFYFCYGPIYVAIIDLYGCSEADAAWIGSIGYHTCFVLGSITSILCNKLGCGYVTSIGGVLTGLGMLSSSFAKNATTLYFTYGILTSMGTSCLFFASLLSLPLYFHSKLGLANGIASAGSGAVGMALSPFFGYCIKNYGLQQTFQLYAIFGLIPLIGGFFIKRKNETKADWSLSSCYDRSLLTNKAFILFTGAMTLILFVFYMPYVHLTNFSLTRGVDRQKSSLLPSILSASAVLGKLFFGYISMLRRVNRLYMFQGFILLLSVSLTLLPLATNYIGFALFAGIFGLNEGGFSPYIIISTSYTVKPSQLAVAFGMMYAVASMFSYFGAPFAAFLYTSTGSYELTFFVSGGIMLLGGISLFFIPYLIPNDILRERKKQKELLKNKLIENTINPTEDAVCEVIVTLDDLDDVTLVPFDIIDKTQSDIISPLQPDKNLLSTKTLLQEKSYSLTHLNSDKLCAPNTAKKGSTLSLFSNRAPALRHSSIFSNVMNTYLEISKSKSISMAIIPPYASQDYVNKYMNSNAEVDAL